MVDWEDGTLVQEAYVEIDGIRYPVVMPEYSGTTPITSENLNKMQTDLQNLISNSIESGTNEHGNYIKFSDGTMICYGRASMSFALDIAYGSAYRADSQTITLPQSFIDTNYRINLQGFAPVHVCYGIDNDKALNSFKFYPVGFVSQSTVTSRAIEFIAIGKWK